MGKGTRKGQAVEYLRVSGTMGKISVGAPGKKGREIPENVHGVWFHS